MEPLAERSADAVRPPAPSGLVTFVFTDGEGSTRLLRELGDAYIDLLDHHHRVLRDAWRRHEGYEFFTEGDAFGVAFASVDQALAACLDAQWHLQNEPWPNGIRMPVRMGVHTGLAAPRAGDYIALAVHQTSRVVAAAHGDQIVVTADALASAGPEFRASARDLGRYRVRDFEDPVHLHEVSDSGLTSTFPALRVLPAQLHNLSRPAGSFVGRTYELDRLEQLVEPGRVVSVVGPGGVGKTRLCTEFAISSVDRWPDGVWFIDLAAIDHGDLVLSATAATLGLNSRNTDTLSAVLDHLSSRSALLVIDNAEHVLGHTARLAAAITGRAPSTGALITSREPLGVDGEHLVRLQPLPDDEAIHLFVDRASLLLAQSGAGQPFAENASGLRELCGRLDHLPLALEMAAARTEIFTVEEILRGIDGQSPGLRSSGTSRDLRHRSLDNLIDWSLQLLAPEALQALNHASSFATSFSAPSLQELLHEQLTESEVEETLYDLARKSLLATDYCDGERRYRLLETVRSHVRSQRSTEQRYQDALTLGRWMNRTLGSDSLRDHRWHSTASAELANLRYVMYLLAPREPETTADLVAVATNFHYRSGSITVGIDELRQVERLLGDDVSSRVRVLTNLAWLELTSDRFDDATESLAEARALLQAVRYAPTLEAELTLTSAELELRLGNPNEALALIAPLLEIAAPRPFRLQMWTLVAIARVATQDLAGAASAGRLVVELAEEQGQTALLVPALSNLADIYFSVAELRLAARTSLEALEIDEQLGSQSQLPYSMLLAAACAAAANLWESTIWLQTRGEMFLREQGVALYPTDRLFADSLINECRRSLGSAATEALIEEALRADLHESTSRAKSVLRRLAEQNHDHRGTGDSRWMI